MERTREMSLANRSMTDESAQTKLDTVRHSYSYSQNRQVSVAMKRFASYFEFSALDLWRSRFLRFFQSVSDSGHLSDSESCVSYQRSQHDVLYLQERERERDHTTKIHRKIYRDANTCACKLMSQALGKTSDGALRCRIYAESWYKRLYKII
ncbi:hypothetical protein X777_14720 [Ooceraea biroi]|uniref:Uncharacterized protein n=1 Tax=Ooceraea biroi TaxID=2015173 RepID=A0A026WRF1_OOCBI|nr:hypothetical protein X777_14720 [Ooceraea biroi]